MRSTDIFYIFSLPTLLKTKDITRKIVQFGENVPRLKEFTELASEDEKEVDRRGDNHIELKNEHSV